jgi:ankyrin repeat protein
LLNVGATVNTENNNNNTPLHFALSFHNYEIADMLIQRGADEKVLNRYGLTPWQCLDNGTSIY